MCRNRIVHQLGDCCEVRCGSRIWRLRCRRADRRWVGDVRADRRWLGDVVAFMPISAYCCVRCCVRCIATRGSRSEAKQDSSKSNGPSHRSLTEHKAGKRANDKRGCGSDKNEPCERDGGGHEAPAVALCGPYVGHRATSSPVAFNRENQRHFRTLTYVPLTGRIAERCVADRRTNLTHGIRPRTADNAAPGRLPLIQWQWTRADWRQLRPADHGPRLVKERLRFLSLFCCQRRRTPQHPRTVPPRAQCRG